MTTDISTLQVKVVSSGITDTANKLDKLAIAADKAEVATKKLGTSVIAAQASMAGLVGGSAALTAAILLLNANINQLTSNTLRTTTATRGHSDAMRDAHAAARGLAGSLGALWMTYGSAIPLMAGAAIGLSFKNIITQGADLEHVLTGIAVKGEESAKSMAEVRTKVIELGQGIYGPLAVAGAMETLVLAGLKAEQAVAAIGPALNLATVGGTTIEKSAYTLVQVGTAMGYTADSFGIVADVIAKTAAVSMSSVESLSEAFKSASSVGVVYGVTLKDLGLSLALLSNLGIQGSAAGTANKNFYKELDSDAKKVTGTLKQLGVDVERDLKIGGKFKDIGSIVKELSDALDKAGEKSGKALQNFTNERGLRQASALVQAYRTNVDGVTTAFDQVADSINKSAGFVAIGAARMAVTSTNQMKATMNSLKTSFAETFESMAPQVNVVAQELKKLFRSEDFKDGLKTVAKELSSFIVLVVKNIPLLFDLAKAFLAIKAGMIVASAIQAAGTALTAFAAAEAAATAGALTLATAFPPLAIAIGIAAAAWATYAFFKNEALDTAPVVSAIATNEEMIDSLKKEADRLEISNRVLAGNTAAKKVAAETTRELAIAEMAARNSKAESSASEQFKKAYSAVGDDSKYKAQIPKLAKAGVETMDTDVAKAVRAYQNWQAAVNNTATSMKNLNTQMDRVVAGNERNETLTQAKMDKEAKAAAARAKLAADLAGNPDVAPKATDPKANAHLEKIQNERLELDRLTSSYREKTEAVAQMTESGIRSMARTQQARVEENAKIAGYYSASEKMDMMTRARKADEAKFEQQKTNAIGENANKITEILNRDIARRAAAANLETGALGMMAKTTAAIMHENSASKELAATQMLRAKAADEVLRVEAAIIKLTTATGSSTQRAQGLMDEADAMMEYGRKAKQTAVQLAEAEIAKAKLTGTGSDAVITARLEAAALEDLAKAYNEYAKLLSTAAERENADALGTAGTFIGAEQAKVSAHNTATQAMIAGNMARAQSAMAIAESSKDPELLAKAKADYAKVVDASKKASDIIKKHFTIDMKVAGLKDVSSMISGLGKAAAGMGESFRGAASALDGLAAGFTALAEVEAKQGIDEQERMQGKIGAYGDMAGAAANFFSEGSRGYKTMMGISQVFHAAEMAMGLVRMGQKAVEAVLNQGSGDPYTAFGRMAAMAAVVAALGFAVGGGFNSNAGGKTAAEVQKTQGTGGVFGDSDAKSASISKSLDLLKDNSNVMLPVNQAMLESLRAIQSSMGGLTNLIVRTNGVANGTNMGIQTGTLKDSRSNAGTLTTLGAIGGAAYGLSAGAILGPLGAVLGGIGGFIIGGIASLWGKTKANIIDSGLNFGGNVSSLQAGKGYSQYASVDTTKTSYFGLKKKTTNRVETQGLSNELSQQFGLIFTNLEDTLKIAGGALGRNASDIGKAIDSMVLSTNSVSLKDLKGDALEAAINGVISKAMDEIAEKAFPAMDAYRQVGEGYAQTVIRVATGSESAKLAMDQLGIKTVDYTAVVNKHGDVAVEMAKQSISAAEGLSGVNAMLQGMGGSLEELVGAYKALDAIRKQMNGVGLNGNKLNVNVVKGAGGVSQLGSALTSYQDKYFTEAEKAAIMLKSLTGDFNKLGVALPANKAALRALIENTGVSTEATSKLTGQLLVLSESYDKVAEAYGTSNKVSTDGLLDTIDALKKFSDSLKSFRDGLLLGDLSTLTPTEKYLEAKRQYESTVSKAMSGDVKAQENVTGSANAYLEASRVVNASDSTYSASFAQVLADVDKLSAITGTKLTEAEKQLEVLNKQNDNLTALNLTAEGIKAGIDNLAVVMPPPVIVSSDPVQAAMLDELALLRKNAEMREEEQRKRDEIGVSSNWDALNAAAKQIVDGSVEAAKETLWGMRNNNKGMVER